MASGYTASDFKLFSNLVLEMRTEIWKLLLEGSRIIAIDDQTRPKDRCVVVTVQEAGSITRVCLPQILLQISHESRGVALKSLNAHVDIKQPTGAMFRILFNSNDIIFINGFRAVAAPLFTSDSVNRERSSFSNLRHLAVHENNMYRFSLRTGDQGFIEAIAKLPNLETLSIVKSKKNDLLHISTGSELVRYLNANLMKMKHCTTSQLEEQFKTEKCLISWSTKRISLQEIINPFMRCKEKNPSWNLPAIKVKAVFNITDFSTMIDDGINNYRETLWDLKHHSIGDPLDSWIPEAEDVIRKQKTRILGEIRKSAELGWSPMVKFAEEVFLIQTEILQERKAQIEVAKPRWKPRRKPTQMATVVESKVPDYSNCEESDGASIDDVKYGDNSRESTKQN